MCLRLAGNHSVSLYRDSGRIVVRRNRKRLGHKRQRANAIFLCRGGFYDARLVMSGEGAPLCSACRQTVVLAFKGGS